MPRMRGSHDSARYIDTHGHHWEMSRQKTDPRARSHNASPLLLLPTEVFALRQCLDGLVFDLNIDTSVYCIPSPERCRYSQSGVVLCSPS